MPEIRLIATDLDGTLIGSINEFPLYNDYRDRIEEMRREHGLIWAACTGRTLASFGGFFAPMRTMGLVPDFVIANHAYIYSFSPLGYMPHILWNLRIRYRTWYESQLVRNAIDDWYDTISSVSVGVTTIRRRKNRLSLRFDSPESADVAANMLEEKAGPYKHLKVFRYSKEVDVRSVPFTKGLAVSELARHLEIGREEILTIGNGHNDISMLDGTVAGMMGCPANSEPEVMETVHKVGGHIAEKRALGGVLEIIEAWRSGKVKSGLPEDWQPPSMRHNPQPKRSAHGRRRKRRVLSLMGMAGIGYAILLVFASVDLIPVISPLIMAPYRLVEKLLIKLFELFV